MRGKQFKIIVKDLDKLEKYGFKKEPKLNLDLDLGYKYRYHLYSGTTSKYGNLVDCIIVRDDDSIVRMQTSGGFALKTLCEMFRDGVIEFVNVNSNAERIKKKQKQIEKLQKEIEALKL